MKPNGGETYEVTLVCVGMGAGVRAEGCEREVKVTRNRNQQYDDHPYVCHQCSWARDFERKSGRRSE